MAGWRELYDISHKINRELRASVAYRIVSKSDPKGVLVVKSYNSQMKKFIVGFTTQVNETGTQVSFGKKTDAQYFLEQVRADANILTRKYSIKTEQLEIFHGRGTTPYLYRLVITQYGPCYIKSYAYAELLKRYYPQTIFDTDLEEAVPELYDIFKVSERQLMIWSWDAVLRKSTAHGLNVFDLKLPWDSTNDVEKSQAARKEFTPQNLQKLVNDMFLTKFKEFTQPIEELSKKMNATFHPLAEATIKFSQAIVDNSPKSFPEREEISFNRINLQNTPEIAKYLTYLIKNVLYVGYSTPSYDVLREDILPPELVKNCKSVLEQLIETAMEEIPKLEVEVNSRDSLRYKTIETEYGELTPHRNLSEDWRDAMQTLLSFWKYVAQFFDERKWRNIAGEKPDVVWVLDALSYFYYNEIVSQYGKDLIRPLCRVDAFISCIDHARDLFGEENVADSNDEITTQELNRYILEGSDQGMGPSWWTNLTLLTPQLENAIVGLKDENQAGESLDQWNDRTVMKCFVSAMHIEKTIQQEDENITVLDLIDFYEKRIKNFVNNTYQKILKCRQPVQKVSDKLPYSTLDNLLVSIPNTEGNFETVYGSGAINSTVMSPKSTRHDATNKPEWYSNLNANQYQRRHYDPNYYSNYYKTEPFMLDPSKGMTFPELYDNWYEDKLSVVEIVDHYTLSLNQVFNSVVRVDEPLKFFSSVYETYKNRKVRNATDVVNTSKWDKLSGKRSNEE